MAKKMIRPIRSEADYDAALEEIERCSDDDRKPGTPDGDRFDLLALIVEATSASAGPSSRPIRSMQSVTAWKRAATPKPISGTCSVPRQRASDILTGKRRLTMRMAWQLHREVCLSHWMAEW